MLKCYFFILFTQKFEISVLNIRKNNFLRCNIFCSGVPLIAASYLQEVVIYGWTCCHRDALMLICCSCSRSAAQTCRSAHAHTQTQRHTQREVVGVDSCWQFAVCGLTCSRCLPVWGSAVFCWTRALMISLFDNKRHCGRQQTVDGYYSTSYQGK